MSYTLQDLLFGVGGTQAAPIGGVCGKLSYRQDILALGGLDKLVAAIIELSRAERFEDLEETGPTVSLIPGQSEYPTSYFTNNGVNPIVNPTVNLIPSFYMEYLIPPSSSSGSGTNLLWKTIDALELMINLQSYSNPAYFTRYGSNFILAPVPQYANPIYLRYQQAHPFPILSDFANYALWQAAMLATVFLLPDEWKEIAEYATALRFATDTRMLDYASQYKSVLHGDPERPGDLGILARRISQNEGDSISMPKQIRVAINRY